MLDLKKVSLTIGIAVIFAFFIYFTIDAIYPEPKYEDFCKVNAYPRQAMPYYEEGKGYTGQNCTPIRGIANLSASCSEKGGYIDYTYDDAGCPVSAVCNMCQKEHDTARKQYALNIFYITAPIGILAIIAGMYLPLAVEAIAAGFMVGGILTLFQSTVRVFGDLGKWSRVILLFAELCIVVWIGLKKVSDYKPRKTKRKK
ncbi:hypothetical protein HY488_00235 [Candidatus Woesearchaeota archaeon]|nr:hypothetical protein [Candidatus Woesearchaeota archaeon]